MLGGEEELLWGVWLPSLNEQRGDEVRFAFHGFEQISSVSSSEFYEINHQAMVLYRRC